MLNTIERRQEILNIVNSIGKVTVEQLAEKFKTSAVTIRNDLNFLNKKSLLVRSHGGAVASERVHQELSIDEKHDENTIIKRAIGQFAASFIKPNQSIIVDSGTTTEEIVKNIGDQEGLRVMTNGLNIAYSLAKNPSVEVMMTGGTLRKKSASFYGRKAEEALSSLRFNTLFLGVDGFDINTGITTYFEPEASLNRVMCKIASEIIVVADSSKFGKNSVYVVTELQNISRLITDSGISDKLAAQLERENITLHVVE
jgi:DeoR family transcriptional regulator, aga operon transcriptional repressor